MPPQARNSNVLSGAIIVYLLSGADVGQFTVAGASMPVPYPIVIEVAALLVWGWFWYLYRQTYADPLASWRNAYWVQMQGEPVLLEWATENLSGLAIGAAGLDRQATFKSITSLKASTDTLVYKKDGSAYLDVAQIRFDFSQKSGAAVGANPHIKTGQQKHEIPSRTYRQARLKCLQRTLLGSAETPEQLVPWAFQWAALVVITINLIVNGVSHLFGTTPPPYPLWW